MARRLDHPIRFCRKTKFTMKESAGTLLYQIQDKTIKVLIVHPSGNYNLHKPWGIPKGLIEPGEDPETAARRETLEETGVIAGELTSLSTIDYTRSKKRVHCFAGPAPADAAPYCASWEVDQARFVELADARRLMHSDQSVLLDRLLGFLESTGERVGVDVSPRPE